MIEFNLKTKTLIGENSIMQIIPFIEDNNFNKIGIILDQALTENKFISKLIKEIKLKNILKIFWIYDLPFEPDYISLDKIKLLFKDNKKSKVDAIISIGGGSVMDFAKGISTLLTNHGSALEYRGFPKNISPSIPLIAIPTTAGTASEVTFNAVFTDTESGKKLGINTHYNFPVLAVLDSNMTLDCPYSVALSSGLDALVHTFESFACNNSNNYTRMFAKQAFKLLFENFENALIKNDSKSRENMLFGAHLAGISLFNSGSGPAGAMSYPLGVVNKVPHGIAGGFILPYLIKFNVDRGYAEYSELYDMLYVNSDLSNSEKSIKIVKLIFDLYDKLKVWDYVKNYKVDFSNKELIDYINLLQGALDQNPIKMNTLEAIDILKQIFNKT